MNRFLSYLLLLITVASFTFSNVFTVDAATTKDAYATQSVLTAPIEIACKSYVLMDLASGQILYEKNADKKVYPASTTKMMTAILAMETLQPESIVTVTQDAIDRIGPGGMNIGCIAGEEFKFKEIIKAVLLTSANECANAIAENSAGSHDAFVAKMNAKAKEIGANSTHFVNVHGMFDENHYSTARNLATIARYALVLSPAASEFSKITKKKSYNLKPTNKHSEWYPYALPITNKLFDYTSEYYKKVLGVKTGFISESGMNFISLVKGKNGQKLLSVICGVDPASPTSIFKYSQMLLDEGYKNFKKKKLINKSNNKDTLTINNLSGIKNDITVLANGKLHAYIEKNDTAADSKIKLSKDYLHDIKVPLKKGEVVGTVTASYNGQVLGTLDLVVEEDVPYDYTGYKRTIIIIYVVLLLFFVSGLVTLGFMSKARRPITQQQTQSDITSPTERANERIRARAEMRRQNSTK